MSPVATMAETMEGDGGGALGDGAEDDAKQARDDGAVRVTRARGRSESGGR